MFDLPSQILKHVAPFIVATNLLFLLAAAVVCGVLVVLLAYYFVRFSGFAISWQPQDFVGAPRYGAPSDPGATSRTAPSERHEATLVSKTASTSPRTDGDILREELLEMAAESARKIRARHRLSEDDILRLQTLDNLMEKIQACQQHKKLAE